MRRRVDLAAGDALAEEALAVARRFATTSFEHGEGFAAFAVEVKQDAAFWVGFV